MAVDVTLDGRAGLARAVDNDYDVIVLDRDLPGVHGDTICEKLIADGCRSRILMLTAAATFWLGPIGAASAIAATTVAWNVAAAVAASANASMRN